VQRLCGIEGMLCEQVLKALVESQFLCVHPNGHYARLTTGFHARPARAVLRTDSHAQKAS
jgi:hypothetical protein